MGRVLEFERFNRYVQRTESCWLWTGGTYPNGYGKFKRSNGQSGGRAALAHRVSYELAFGSIAGVINHTCEVKRCVNPAHLEDVSQRENVRFSLSGLCVRGHDLASGDVYITRAGKRACRECRRIRRAPSAGDIGKPIRHIELEPVENPQPARQPEPVVTPEPEQVPA